MKRLLILLAFIFVTINAWACPVCEKQQPAVLKGISHGTGPQNSWDMLIIWATVALVLLTLVLSIKYLVRPGEKSESHIKRFILNNDL